MRIVPVEHASGLFLSEDMYDINGHLLVRKGTQVTSKIITQLNSSGVFSLYIDDRYSQNELHPPISSDLRLQIIREMNLMYEIIRLRHEGGKDVNESYIKHLPRVLDLADHVHYEIMRTSRQYINFTDIKMRDFYTVSHSVNVAMLALLLSIDAGVPKDRQKDLFLGALFHDIGMNYIDERVFMKNGKLDVQEFLKIKEHPKKGYELFKDFSFANSYMKIIVLQHHEKLDGTGYPSQNRDNEIHTLARITAIADSYDAMTSDRPYSRAVSPQQALQYLDQSSGKHLDPTLTQLFTRKVQPFPEGALVRLSNELVALVTTANRNEPLKPTVQLIHPDTKALMPMPVDLSRETALFIESIQYELP